MEPHFAVWMIACPLWTSTSILVIDQVSVSPSLFLSPSIITTLLLAVLYTGLLQKISCKDRIS